MKRGIKGLGLPVVAAAAMFVFSLAAPAVAGQQASEQKTKQMQQETRLPEQQARQLQQPMESRQQQPMESGQQPMESRQEQQAQQTKAAADYNLRLNDWVWVGYDWDRDGKIDYGEYMFSYDIQRARASSQVRASQEGVTQEQAAGRTGDFRTVTGNVKSLKKAKFVGMDEQHVIARVQTRQGRTARVDLGPESNLRNANLREGDRVTVQGRRGTVNDEGVLMADAIRTGDRNIAIKRTGDFNMKRYSGEIVKVKTATPKSFSAREQVFARVKLDRGPTSAVHLGPKDKLQGTDLQNLEGKKIAFLAHKANIGDKTALVADQVRLDNRTINLDWSSKAAQAGAVRPGEGQAGQQQRQQF